MLISFNSRIACDQRCAIVYASSATGCAHSALSLPDPSWMLVIPIIALGCRCSPDYGRTSGAEASIDVL